MKRGVDVSRCQFEPSPGRFVPLTSHQWRATGLDFAIIRCGNGNAPGGPDPTFVQSMVGARTAGLAVGAYHVAFPLPDDGVHAGRAPEEQARSHFMQCGALGQLQGTLPVAIDVEWPPVPQWRDYGITGASILAWLASYGRLATALYGRTPMLYTYPDYWAHVVDGNAPGEVAALFRLWLADYSPGAANHTVAPWDRATLVQYGGGTGKLPNGAPVDVDEFTGSDAEWDALIAA